MKRSYYLVLESKAAEVKYQYQDKAVSSQTLSYEGLLHLKIKAQNLLTKIINGNKKI